MTRVRTRGTCWTLLLDRQLGHAALDLVTDLAHRLEILPRGILEIPVDVALARNDGTGVAAAHRDDEVRPLRIRLLEVLRNSLCQLGHQLCHLWMDVLRRRRSGRACRPSTP